MIRNFKTLLTGLFAVIVFGSINCSKKSVPAPPDPPPFHYKTENVVIVVVDGARYTETWGEPTRQFIPKRNALLQQGVICDAIYNNGVTKTVPGHTAIATGIYQSIANNGMEFPKEPSILQSWLKKTKEPSSEAWIIATKDKLQVLADCEDPAWKGTYNPMTDCGINGLGTGYRLDQTTFQRVTATLTKDHPKLLLINFKQPDDAGHEGDSLAYLNGIVDTDNYVDLLWKALQSDAVYKDKTTLIVTNDHGRHTAGHLDGFVSHGDDCDGCRHIEMFAIGPDFKKNFTSNSSYDLIDITSTVAELLYFDMPFAKGKVITDIFTQMK